MIIRKTQVSDAADICGIYNQYVKNTVITFETDPVSEREMARRISVINAEGLWITAEEEEGVAGYAYACQWKSREAYRYTAEVSVYLSRHAAGKGMGTALYDYLLNYLRQKEYHSVVSCIALPNEGSVALHEKFGFKKVAHFTEAGKKFGRWIDVAYWELLLYKEKTK